MSDWDVLVAKDDLRKIEVREAAPRAPLADGEVRLEVERFSLTANNITYGLIGEAFGYWKFFPAGEGLGRIPVWGFAKVVESNAADAPVGLRVFGYLPMSSSFVARLARKGGGYVDTSAHRAELPPTYNAYAEAPQDAMDDHRALLRPLFMTSWLLDDFLSEDGALKTLVLSSASSKTAMGLAWFARRRGMPVAGLTSPGNAQTLAGLGLYDRIVPYDEAGSLKVEGPAVYVDFAGDARVNETVHAALGGDLARSIIVGGTHWSGDRAPRALAGPQPVLFFAPDQIRKRAAEWGQQELDARFTAALGEFVADAGWLKLKQSRGPEGLLAAYREVLEGRARPDEGHIIRPV